MIIEVRATTAKDPTVVDQHLALRDLAGCVTALERRL
jgi:hypothetical protein